MALTANTLPSVPADFTVPIDANLQFASAQTLTATGYVNNTTTQLDLGLGRFTGMLTLDISALDVSSGNETYQFTLMGSNDANWGNGNVDVLAFYDAAAASAGRIVPTICGVTPTFPPTGRAGQFIYRPFTNLADGIIFRYAQLYLTAAGTTPSVTLSAWITPMRLAFM